MSVDVNRADIMTDSGKPLRETRTPDNAVRNLLRTLILATVNNGSMVGRSSEVVDMLCRSKVDVAGLQEVRYKNQGTEMLKGENRSYKLFWSGTATGQCGVGMMVHNEWAKQVIGVRRVSARISVEIGSRKRSCDDAIRICSSVWLEY